MNPVSYTHLDVYKRQAAGSTITDDIPAMALAIARARQTNKKDWAAKHKLKESK